MNRGRGPVLVTVVVAVALAIAAVAALARTGPSLLGSNGVAPVAFVVVLPADGRACDAVTVPAAARSVRMTLGTYGRPGAVTVTGTAHGRTVLAGRARFREGVVDIPVARRPAAARSVRLCVTNAAAGSLAVGGRTTSTAAPAGALAPGSRPSFEFPSDGEGATWLDRAGHIARNAGYARFLPGGEALLWLALVLAACAGGAAVAVVLRTGDER